ncbi:hypothetical protein JOF58_004958 [Streptomyces cinnamonensis]|nr:hypothetical protein [Streptomyces virginiae]
MIPDGRRPGAKSPGPVTHHAVRRGYDFAFFSRGQMV